LSGEQKLLTILLMESSWILVISAVLAGALVSLAGGLYLLYGKVSNKSVQRIAVPFAAGALLAAVFLDLLPEALIREDARVISMAVLAGFVGFFILERFLHWFHHHRKHAEGQEERSTRSSATTLVVIGDTAHNFIDGLAIGAAFLVSPITGIITTIAIAAHEIPQEIGDFGLLLSKGVKRSKVLLFNALSALATIVGAVLVFGLGEHFVIPQAMLLAITAGFFIYIAASDIVPAIHAEPSTKVANLQTLILLGGMLFVGMTTTLAHQFMHHHPEVHVEEGHHEPGHDHEHHHEHEGSHHEEYHHE